MEAMEPGRASLDGMCTTTQLVTKGKIVLCQGRKGSRWESFLSAQNAELWCLWKEAPTMSYRGGIGGLEYGCPACTGPLGPSPGPGDPSIWLPPGCPGLPPPPLFSHFLFVHTDKVWANPDRAQVSVRDLVREGFDG